MWSVMMCNTGANHSDEAVSGSSPVGQGGDVMVASPTSEINVVALTVGLTLVGLLHLAIILAVTLRLYR